MAHAAQAIRETGELLADMAGTEAVLLRDLPDYLGRRIKEAKAMVGLMVCESEYRTDILRFRSLCQSPSELRLQLRGFVVVGRERAMSRILQFFSIILILMWGYATAGVQTSESVSNAILSEQLRQIESKRRLARQEIAQLEDRVEAEVDQVIGRLDSSFHSNPSCAL